jgi:hypothetical protein
MATSATPLAMPAAGSTVPPDSSVLADRFRRQAEVHRKFARVYLAASILSAAATVMVGLWLLGTIPGAAPSNNAAWVDFIRDLAPRVFVTGAMVFVVRFFVHNLQINKHLEVANTQRRNTLDTYQLLVAATTTEWAKDRVSLLMAASAVTPFDTGYLSNGQDAMLDPQIAAILNMLISH